MVIIVLLLLFAMKSTILCTCKQHKDYSNELEYPTFCSEKNHLFVAFSVEFTKYCVI